MMCDGQEKLATPVLVSDFDGTMTQQDFYVLARNYLVPPDTPDYWQEYLAGRMTHFEALRRIFAAIRSDEPTMLATARRMELDAALPAAVHRLQDAGWEIVVASAGCLWYIERLLGEQDLALAIHGNPGHFSPQQGLVMSLPTASPYYSAETGISKTAVVEAAVRTHAAVAFAGDGRPDLPAALLVPAHRRFARGWLAEHLQAQGIPFRPFASWSDIAAQLLEDSSSC